VDFGLSDEQQMLKEVAQAFVAEVCPPERAKEWDEAETVPEELFKGRHFDREIVVLCVRWYLSYKLSYRDLKQVMHELDVSVAPCMILRWVSHIRWLQCAASSLY